MCVGPIHYNFLQISVLSSQSGRKSKIAALGRLKRGNEGFDIVSDLSQDHRDVLHISGTQVHYRVMTAYFNLCILERVRTKRSTMNVMLVPLYTHLEADIPTTNSSLNLTPFFKEKFALRRFIPTTTTIKNT